LIHFYKRQICTADRWQVSEQVFLVTGVSCRRSKTLYNMARPRDHSEGAAEHD